MRTLNLTFALLMASGTALAQVPPTSFPADAEFIPIRCDGGVSTDPTGDAPMDHRDIVGAGTDASTYYAVDDTYMYLRVRLGDSPVGAGGNYPFKSFGWSWGLDTDHDGEFEAFVLLDGNGGPLGDNLSVVDQDPDNGMTADVVLRPVDFAIAAYADAEMVGTNLGMNGGDWFLTVAVPLTTLESFGVSGTFYCYPGTSSNSSGIDTDWACYDSEPATILDVPVEPVAVSCGNGMLDMGETCDDSDADSGDGCSSSCLTEPGYVCTGEPSTCEVNDDLDGDGVPNDSDGDIDGDGIPNADEGDGDIDGDGLPNSQDLDSDGDGIPDEVEGNDADMDGVADFMASGTDTDGDGIDNAYDTDDGGMAPALQNTDGDGTPDFLDSDDDGDGSSTRAECPNPMAACPDTDADGRPDYLDADGMTGSDADGDGIPDDVECPDMASCPDTDGDGTPDFEDPDDDGDGVDTSVECPNPAACVDTDDDGALDYLDDDDDGDGLPTATEVMDTADASVPDDIDADGLPNWRDTDSNGDGIADGDQEADGDGNGVPDYLDFTDTDGDSIPDVVECPDDPDFSDCPDTDGDGTPDYMDEDDDGDGIPTREERMASGMNDDVDEDGIVNWLDPDSNDDGIADGEQQGDTDGDGVPDYLEAPDLVPGLAGGACAVTSSPGSTPWVLLLSLVALWRRRR